MPLFQRDPEKIEDRIRRACDEHDEKYLDKCFKKGKAMLIKTVRIIGEEQMDSYIPRLCQMIDSPDRDKRLAIVYALGEFRYPTAVTFLVRRLEIEDDPEVEEEIHKAIAKYRG